MGKAWVCQRMQTLNPDFSIGAEQVVHCWDRWIKRFYNFAVVQYCKEHTVSGIGPASVLR
jgi:hypothetical protein